VATLGSIELEAAVDVKKGEKTTISKLFTVEERKKYFNAEVDAPTAAKIRVNVAKLEPLETIADLGSKKGEQASLWRLLKIWDLDKELTATDDIKKGEKLKVTVEVL